MFSSFITRRAAIDPRLVAIRDSQSDGLTYRDFNNQINGTARLLQTRIKGSRQKVGLRVESLLSHWLVTMALARLGHYSFMLPPGDEMWGAEVIVGENPVPNAPPSITQAILPAGWRVKLAKKEHDVVREAASWSDPARIILSSGTTGRRKAVLLTHANLYERINRSLTSEASSAGNSPATRTLVSFLPGGIGGVVAPLRTWVTGGSVVVAQPGRSEFSRILESSANSFIMSVTQLRNLIETLPADHVPDPGITIITGGSLLPRALAAAASKRLTPNVIVVYGSTEGGSVAGGPVSKLDTENNEVGFIYPWAEVQALDADGNPLPPGATGEIRLRQPEMVTRYEDDDEMSAITFRDGWFHPGDLGSVSANGVLRITGRVGDMMNLGGVKLAPDALEERLRVAPGVADVVAFSVKDKLGIEQLHVAVVRSEGFDEAAFRLLIKDNLNSVDMHLHYVQAVPRNELGKAERHMLRVKYSG